MNITINEKEYALQSTIKSLIIYEDIMDESFSPKGLKELMVYFFCVLMASNKEWDMEYSAFIDYVDKNPDLFTQFSKWFTDVSANENKLKKD